MVRDNTALVESATLLRAFSADSRHDIHPTVTSEAARRPLCTRDAPGNTAQPSTFQVCRQLLRLAACSHTERSDFWVLCRASTLAARSAGGRSHGFMSFRRLDLVILGALVDADNAVQGTCSNNEGAVSLYGIEE